MIESPFGSSPSTWIGIPSSGIGGLQTPPIASRPLTGGLAGFGSPIPIAQVSIPQVPLPQSPVSQSLAGSLPGGGQGYPINVWPLEAYGYGYGGPFAAAGIPRLLGPEVVTGVTVPALLAAVAMRRGQPLGPTNDPEIEDFVYDAFELLPGTNEVEVRCDGGRATLTGSVPHRRLKRDVGEIVWAIPNINDVQNNVTITTRRRTRTREGESVPIAGSRKQA